MSHQFPTSDPSPAPHVSDALADQDACLDYLFADVPDPLPDATDRLYAQLALEELEDYLQEEDSDCYEELLAEHHEQTPDDLAMAYEEAMEDAAVALTLGLQLLRAQPQPPASDLLDLLSQHLDRLQVVADLDPADVQLAASLIRHRGSFFTAGS